MSMFFMSIVILICFHDQMYLDMIVWIIFIVRHVIVGKQTVHDLLVHVRGKCARMMKKKQEINPRKSLNPIISQNLYALTPPSPHTYDIDTTTLLSSICAIIFVIYDIGFGAD